MLAVEPSNRRSATDGPTVRVPHLTVSAGSGARRDPHGPARAGSARGSSPSTRCRTPVARWSSSPPADLAGPEGELAGRDRPGTEEPRAGHRRRVAARDREQPLLRPAQRPDHVTAGHAATVDAVGLAGGTAGTLTSRWRRASPSSSSAGACRQVFFNALLAAQAAVLHDQVPTVSGASSPASSGSACRSRRWPAPFWCRRSTRSMLTMFLVPCAGRGAFVLVFAHGCLTVASTPPSGSRGPCASWPAPSTSTPGATRTSRGPSRHGSSS